MFVISGKQIVRLSIFCSLLIISQAIFAQDKDWREVTPAELAMKTPRVEPDADAEAIFWETRIDDSASDKLSRINYVRVKIFNERGREKFSKVDIPFFRFHYFMFRQCFCRRLASRLAAAGVVGRAAAIRQRCSGGRAA